ncbi:hypothetical protein [Terricaulis sp.]|uniref:hypothetical protein n=1 Tax=Terricaulis sp. TaxID=2768686 RepID=UPI002AC79C67|nr:hypothetical protein [Terricaulis sp.]MDZ4690530.1 hypothetical protein [Terricaulis sp.]
MPLIVVRDAKLNRDRIINTDYIFHCFEQEDCVRINYSEGVNGRGHCVVAGTLEEFAKAVGAVRARV